MIEKLPRTYAEALKSPYYREKFRELEKAAKKDGLVGLLCGESFIMENMDWHAWRLFYKGNPQIPEWKKLRRIPA